MKFTITPELADFKTGKYKPLNRFTPVTSS
jgi:hypothetical protein